MAIGDGFGRSGLQAGVPDSVTVGATSTAVLSSSATQSLEYIALCNDSNETIYLGIGAAAVMNKGIRLNANGGSIVFETQTIPRGLAINAICASGSKVLCTQVAS